MCMCVCVSVRVCECVCVCVCVCEWVCVHMIPVSLQHFPETATSVVFEYSLTEDGNSDMLTAPARELKLMEVHKVRTCVRI